MRYLFFILLLNLIYSCKKENTLSNSVSTTLQQEQKPEIDLRKTKEKAKDALEFCKEKKYNTQFCILVDMSLHSGVYRMMVWDFKENKISHKYLVGHGCGNSSWSKDDTKDNPGFSNTDGSHLSSLGKYKIGERGYSDWGVHTKYLLHGLENTNSNALQRFIVFHSWELMSDEEVFPKGSPEGWGCPTISNNAFQEIDVLMKNSPKPVLFWMYQ